jgi:hypothetical protein
MASSMMVQRIVFAPWKEGSALMFVFANVTKRMMAVMMPLQ